MLQSTYPENTKQTRTNNNLNFNQERDFFRPIISNPSVPITYNHDSYMIDDNAKAFYMMDIERASLPTRNNCMDVRKPVQNAFQNNYNFNEFQNLSLNSSNNNNIDNNKFLTRNTVNTRRDNFDKIRKIEAQEFLEIQGGILNNFQDFKLENTRKNRNDINSSQYIPMPRTMAIPKENI
jgi:hypothetical protein